MIMDEGHDWMMVVTHESQVKGIQLIQLWCFWTIVSYENVEEIKSVLCFLLFWGDLYIREQGTDNF